MIPEATGPVHYFDANGNEITQEVYDRLSLDPSYVSVRRDLIRMGNAITEVETRWCGIYDDLRPTESNLFNIHTRHFEWNGRYSGWRSQWVPGDNNREKTLAIHENLVLRLKGKAD